MFMEVIGPVMYCVTYIYKGYIDSPKIFRGIEKVHIH